MDARTVLVRFAGDTRGLNQASEQGERSVSRFSERSHKALKVAQAGALAFGGALVGALKGGIEGILEGEEAEAKFSQTAARMDKAVRINEESFKSFGEEIQKTTRYSYEDALAVGQLLAAQDGAQAVVKAGVASYEDLAKVTLDLATAQGIDGPAAAKLLGKALAQPEKAAGTLRKAGILLTDQEQKLMKKWVDAGDKGKAYGLIMDKVKDKTEGAAKAAGETTAGQLDRAKAAWGEVEESLAGQMLPAINGLMRGLTKFSAWAEAHPGKVAFAVKALGTLAVVIGVITIATKTWTAAMTVATVAQTLMWRATGVGTIITAIALVVAAVVVMYKKFDWFRYGVNTVLSFIVTAVVKMADTWLAVWQKVFEAMGKIPIIGKQFRGVADKIQGARDKINGLADDIKNKLPTSVTMELKVNASKAYATLASYEDALAHAIRAGETKGVPYKGGFAPVSGGSFAGRRATGGSVFAGRSYLIGERGPEVLTMGASGFVTPNDRLGGGDTVVKVYIGDQELRGIVRSEVSESNRGLRASVARRRR